MPVQVLTLELDAERERRWKAEQAASRLVEHVQKLQSRVTEQETRQELTVVRGAKLERELEGERDTSKTLQTQVQQLQEEVGTAQREKVQSLQREEKQVKLLRELEQNYQRLESEKIKERALLQSRVRDTEAQVAGHERELEVLRRSLQHGNNQVRQLQELLAKREQEHLADKERHEPLDGRKVQDLVTCRVNEEREKAEAISAQLKSKISEHEKAYRALEDEFRAGLRIEASRYGELEQIYREVCGEVEATRQTAVTAVQKERRAVAMVEELTAVVKELQGRVRELTNSKQEAVEGLRERVTTLEKEIQDRNKLEAKMLSLQEVLGNGFFTSFLQIQLFALTLQPMWMVLSEQ